MFGLRQPKSEKEIERKALLKALRQAQHEMDVALSYFHESTDPEIIDHAIYLMEAARKKYSYFLRKARQDNLFTS
ncbi:MAG: YaaL family protein [Firmicutes bacterium]|nr:YaaL family protein [Candidatus Fermentithermobacillaceae bacterium]